LSIPFRSIADKLMKPSRSSLKSQIAVSTIMTLLMLAFIQFGRFLCLLPEERADLFQISLLVVGFLVFNGYFYMRRSGRSQFVPPVELDDEDEEAEPDSEKPSS